LIKQLVSERYNGGGVAEPTWITPVQVRWSFLEKQ
jgi:hypothetical protein